MAVIGLLMFGDHLRDEVTSNIIMTKGYPHAISVCIVVFIAIIPLTKVPLKYAATFSQLCLGLQDLVHDPYSSQSRSCVAFMLATHLISHSVQLVHGDC